MLVIAFVIPKTVQFKKNIKIVVDNANNIPISRVFIVNLVCSGFIIWINTGTIKTYQWAN
ncbi:hypothetical protein [Mycoplasmopsis felis]|uniref:hypothetical protein n=1 Tax=Mycoplasmopsis felis TaxID=33923 RepID=UPI0021B058AF|nr:hypothetical protein [Mycoplasmopsis felis]UWV84088.1 hypothetical protein NWE58_00955 [Mycoplasmopsis felis]